MILNTENLPNEKLNTAYYLQFLRHLLMVTGSTDDAEGIATLYCNAYSLLQPECLPRVARCKVQPLA